MTKCVNGGRKRGRKLLKQRADSPSLALTASFSVSSLLWRLPPSLARSDEMDEMLMTFVNCLGAVIMVSLVGFHYLTASPKDAEH